MTTVNQVAAGLAEAASFSGLECLGYETLAVTAPIGHVRRDSFDPRMVFSEVKAARRFQILCYVNPTDQEGATQTLNDLCELSGDGSLVAAVQDGDNWTVDVDYAVVTNISAIQWVESVANSGVFHARVVFDVEVCW